MIRLPLPVLAILLCACPRSLEPPPVPPPLPEPPIVEATPEPPPEPTPPVVVPVVPRAVWGRDLHQGTFTTHTIERITVHHTATPWREDTDGAQRTRSHTRGHLGRGWPDLAYHLLIDGHGVVREGRPLTAVGDTGTNYDPTGYLLVTLEGNFEDQEPSPEQLDAAVRVLAWGSATFGVPPEAIDGHRDHAATLCPGESLYALVSSGALRDRVQAVLDAGGARLEPQDCVVAVDVGHSKDAAGATSARGVPEHTFNRRLAEELVAALSAAEGVDRAFLIDPEDVGLPLGRRAPLAVEGGATVFLSMHHDSVQSHYLQTWTVDGVDRPYADAFAGHSLFVSRTGGDPAASEAVGRAIGGALRGRALTPTTHHAEPISGENRDWIDAGLGLHAYDSLAVLRTAQIPAVLVEAGVILHRDEEARLATAEGRAPILEGITEGVQAWCSTLSVSGDAPPAP